MCSSFLAFVAFSNGKPDSTFPENALEASASKGEKRTKAPADLPGEKTNVDGGKERDCQARTHN
jgi:hypothetical protein